jgi:glycosyltransferase involved in cell wall biosynthesis
MSHTLPQMLMSIVGQSYDNWKVCVTDDMSNPEHIEESIRVIERFYDFMGSDGRKKLFFYGNTRKKWEVENVLTMIRTDCEDDDIVCRIDADDWLTELDALAYLNALYEQTGAEALWTAHRWAFTDKNISGPMPAGVDVYQYPWVSSHLKTFRKRLINNVKDENFRGEDGEYIRRAGDQAIYLPVLHNTQRRGYVPRCMYHYTIKDVPETYQTDDARFQRDEALFLRARGYVK